MMLKEFDQASNLLHDLLSAAEVRQSLREIVHYRTWLARLLYQQGNLPAALRVLQKAVRISANQGFVRSILDVGDPGHRPAGDPAKGKPTGVGREHDPCPSVRTDQSPQLPA